MSASRHGRFAVGVEAVGVLAVGAMMVVASAGCAGSSTRRWTPLSEDPTWTAASTSPSPSASSTMLFGSTRVVDAPAPRSDLGAMDSAPEPRRSAPTSTPTSARSAPARGSLAVGLDSGGQVVTSNDFRGKVVVLDFWATWCGPCKASSPAFQQLSERFAGDARVMTLAIHTDDTGDPRAYMREHGYTFRMVPRGQEFASAYGVNVLPTFIVLDARGREIYRDTGMMGDSQRAEVERLVRSSLR